MAPTLVDCAYNLFGDCSIIPSEQQEYFPFVPLLQPFDNVEWSDDEEDETESVRVVALPEQSELEELLRKNGKGHLVGQSAYSKEEAVEVARIAGCAPDKSEEASAPHRQPLREIRRWLATVAHPEDTESYFLKLFKFMDPADTGTVTSTQLRNILTTLGGENALTQGECDAFFRKMRLAEGEEIVYKDFVRQILP